MKFVLLQYNRGSYDYEDSSDLKMYLLGRFFTDDVGSRTAGFREWTLGNQDETSSNITALEKKDEYVYLTDLYSDKKQPTACKISIEQFLKLLEDWDSIIKLAHRPERLMITYANDQFSIEAVN